MLRRMEEAQLFHWRLLQMHSLWSYSACGGTVQGDDSRGKKMNVWIWKIAPRLQFSIQDKFNQNSSKPQFYMEKYNLKHIKETEGKHYLFVDA